MPGDWSLSFRRSYQSGRRWPWRPSSAQSSFWVLVAVAYNVLKTPTIAFEIPLAEAVAYLALLPQSAGLRNFGQLTYLTGSPGT